MFEQARKSKRVTIGGIFAAIGGALLTAVTQVIPTVVPVLAPKAAALIGAGITVVGAVAAGVGKALGSEEEAGVDAEEMAPLAERGARDAERPR